MKYLKLLFWIGLLALVSLFKRGKGMRSLEYYLIRNINAIGLFRISISSIQYKYPNIFIFDLLKINTKLGLSFEFHQLNVRGFFLLSLQANVKKVLLYNNEIVDIHLTNCRSILRIRPTFMGVKVVIVNQIMNSKIVATITIIKNVIAKTNTIQFHCSPFSIHHLISMFSQLSFPTLRTFRFAGKKELELEFIYNMRKPLEYRFRFALKGKRKFELIDPFGFEFDFLQNNKLQTIIDNTSNVKSFLFDKENKDFVSINDMPDILLKTIITTEDPNFLFHSGFDVDSFGFALATNIAEKKFSRGGSTISMQLVRNLYLHHSKTFSRKIEEIILTWIIEDQLHIPKDKILEIYLNRIEMGPAIYGIKEAAFFYFNKNVEDLTLLDSLVLSYIIPRPMHFLPALVKLSPVLKKNLKAHITKYAALMRHRDLITKQEFDGLGNNIHFATKFGKFDL